MTASRERKRDSAWHNFRGAATSVMRAAGRVEHPTRELTDDLFRRWFGDREFDWLDVGVVGMVDYERLRPRMRFRYVGADMSESVLEASREYLRSPSDRLIVWDIEEEPDSAIEGAFDVVTLRHVLNHCEDYERPLAHVSRVLRPGGRIVVVLHLALVEGTDRPHRHRDWSVPGEVIGNRYGRERFFRTFGAHFDRALWVRVDEGHKPNDLIVGRLRMDGGSTSDLPRMHRIFAPMGKRGLPARLLARARSWWLSRET